MPGAGDLTSVKVLAGNGGERSRLEAAEAKRESREAGGLGLRLLHAFGRIKTINRAAGAEAEAHDVIVFPANGLAESHVIRLHVDDLKFVPRVGPVGAMLFPTIAARGDAVDGSNHFSRRDHNRCTFTVLGKTKRNYLCPPNPSAVPNRALA